MRSLTPLFLVMVTSLVSPLMAQVDNASLNRHRDGCLQLGGSRAPRWKPRYRPPPASAAKRLTSAAGTYQIPGLPVGTVHRDLLQGRVSSPPNSKTWNWPSAAAHHRRAPRGRLRGGIGRGDRASGNV